MSLPYYNIFRADNNYSCPPDIDDNKMDDVVGGESKAEKDNISKVNIFYHILLP